MTDLEKQQISELIKQAKEGNQLAFTKLYEKYKQIIYCLLLLLKLLASQIAT